MSQIKNEDGDDKIKHILQPISLSVSRSNSLFETKQEKGPLINKNKQNFEETKYTTKKTNSLHKDTLSPVSRETSYNTYNNINTSNVKEKQFKTKPGQACDRCRTKKIRCDLKHPQCTACSSVGFECKFTDKLLRKTYPRGYTESLEERIRELEAENRKLSALSDVKQQQIEILENSSSSRRASASSGHSNLEQLPLITSEKISGKKIDSGLYNVDDIDHVCDGLCVHKTLHPQPVATSFNLNDPTSISFEQDKAPGLNAAKALDTLADHEESTQLTTLVSLSVPRSTEEILFVPQLLAKVRQEYGFTSKQCLYSVTLLSSLKDDLPPPFLKQNSMMLLNNTKNFDILSNTNLWQIQNLYNFIHNILKFDILKKTKKDSKSKEESSSQFDLSFKEIEELVDLFFSHWSKLIPVLNEEEFRVYFERFKKDILSLEQLSVSTQPINNLLNIKYFACLLVVLCQMGLVTKFKNSEIKYTSKYSKLLSYYNHLLHLYPRNSFFSVTTTSLRTLQLLCLLLYYFLNTGDIVQLYDLRGTIVTMSQQLRLHRCPSAVLTGSGKKMKKLEQSNRRRLFWCTYYLDVFASFQLGVPRLLKDHEIECALPFSIEEEVSQTNDIKLEGYVTNFSLAIIRFAKVMGNILDTIHKRNVANNNIVQTATIHENALDQWRNSLSKEYEIKVDVAGKTILKDTTVDKLYLIILFQLAKCMIQLPLCAAVMLPVTEEAYKGSSSRIRSLPSYIALHQSVNILLTAYRKLGDIYISLPINTSRVMTRFALISAKESLEYKKKGNLFEENKQLLLGVVKDIEVNRQLELPGVISWYSLEMLDLTINLFLQIPILKGDKLEKFLQKKLNHYKKRADVSPKKRRKSSDSDKITNNEESNRSGKRKLSNEVKCDKVESNKKLKVPSNDKGETKILSPPGILKQVEPTDVVKNPKLPKQDPKNLTIPKQDPTNQITSQNQFVEALQEDPILNLNANRFSNMSLVNFYKNNIAFGEDDSKKKEATKIDTNIPSLTESVPTANSIPSPGYFDNDVMNESNNILKAQLSNSSFSNLLTFWNNGETMNQFNLDSLYDNGNLFESSSEKAGNSGNSIVKDDNLINAPGKNTTLVDFGSIIDASLGLAPLLVDNNKITTTTNNNNNNGIFQTKEGPKDQVTETLSKPSEFPFSTDLNKTIISPQEILNKPKGNNRDPNVLDDISKWQNR